MIEKPRMTEAQALQAARALCQRLHAAGWKCQPGPRATFQPPDNKPFGALWSVPLTNGGELFVQDRSGIVVNLRGPSLGNVQPEPLTPQKRKFLLGRIQTLRSIFWGKSDVFATEHSEQGMRANDGYVMFSHNWERRFRGVRYEDQSFEISLQMSGELVYAVLRNWTPEPQNLTERISEEQARQIALRKARTKETLLEDGIRSEKRVVLKNRFWEGKSELPFLLHSSHLAWLVTIPLARRQGRDWIKVGVDISTGEVLCGTIQGRR